MLSDNAVATLAFLRAIADDGGACNECVGVYVGIDRNEALDSIRELLVASRILYTYDRCVICRQRRLVARVWRPASAARPPPDSGATLRIGTLDFVKQAELGSCGIVFTGS